MEEAKFLESLSRANELNICPVQVNVTGKHGGIVREGRNNGKEAQRTGLSLLLASWREGTEVRKGLGRFGS